MTKQDRHRRTNHTMAARTNSNRANPTSAMAAMASSDKGALTEVVLYLYSFPVHCSEQSKRRHLMLTLPLGRWDQTHCEERRGGPHLHW